MRGEQMITENFSSTKISPPYLLHEPWSSLGCLLINAVFFTVRLLLERQGLNTYNCKSTRYITVRISSVDTGYLEVTRSIHGTRMLSGGRGIGVETLGLFASTNCSSVLMDSCRSAAVVSDLGCWEKIVKSPAYVRIFALRKPGVGTLCMTLEKKIKPNDFQNPAYVGCGLFYVSVWVSC